MKKSILLFILIAMSMILVSCGEDEKADSFEGMDSKTFLESITLPDKLSIDVNLDEVKNPSEAKTYKADYIEFDKQKLIDAFVKNNITEEKIWAEGPQIIASDGNIKEFLSIYDGGKSFGTVTDMKGGFSYSKEINSIPSEKLDTVASILFNDPDFDAQKYGYALNSDYASYKDLDFLSYKDTLADIKRIFDVAGMPQFDVDETYSLELETITSHYKLYLNSEIAEDDRRSLKWTKDDECYIFSLRQLVDNIPIVNKGWQMPDGTKASAWGNPMPATCIYLAYDKTGIRKIVAYNILNITDCIGIVIFSLLMSVFFPLFNQISSGDSYIALLENNKPIIYLLVIAVHYSLSAALFAGGAIAVSAFISNKFSVIAAPIVIYFVLMLLATHASIPVFLKPDFLVQSIYPNVSPSAAFLYKLIPVIVLLGILLFVTVKQIKRRIETS